MNGFVAALPFPLLIVTIVAAFLALVLLADLDRTVRPTWAGHAALCVAVVAGLLAAGVAVSS